MTIWPVSNLGDLCTFITDGSHNPPKGVEQSDFYMLSSRDIQNGKLTFEKPRYLNAKDFAVENKRTDIKVGDVLLTTVGTIGRTAIYNGTPEHVTFQRSVSVLRPNQQKITSKFLMYFLDSITEYLNREARGVAQQGIYLNQVRKLSVPVPPIEEQYKVVELLDDHLSGLDAALLDVMQAKLNAFQFRRSILHAAFTGNIDSYGDKRVTELPIGWEMRTLSNCLEKLKSGKMAERGWSPQCLSHPTNDENTWGVLKTTSVQMGEYQPQYNKELPESLTPKIGLEVNPGDFLVTTTGPRNRCGVICHVKTTPRKLIFSGKILRFRANEEIVLPNWLLYILMSPEYQTTLDRLKVGTSDSSVSIGNQQILDLVIPVPSIEVQLKILQLLEVNLSNLEASVSLIDSMEKQSGGLRRSLLQAAFSGQLTKEVAIV
jgi:type I restriction enzyme S subunit